MVNAQNTVVTLNEEIAVLNSFKAEVEKNEKMTILAKYEKLLSVDVLSAYAEKIDTYADAKSLDKDLAYEVISTNQSVFSANVNTQPAYVPRDNNAGNGLEGILDKYKK